MRSDGARLTGLPAVLCPAAPLLLLQVASDASRSVAFAAAARRAAAAADGCSWLPPPTVPWWAWLWSVEGANGAALFGAPLMELTVLPVVPW